VKLSFLLAGVGAVAAAATLIVVYVVEKPSPDGATLAAPPAVETIPTPQYLLPHPDALKEAEQKCQDGSAPSSLYCSNVHKAESLRLAEQYRQGSQPEGIRK
jgi:hypothetical protein